MTFDISKPYACRNGYQAEVTAKGTSFLSGAYIDSHERPWSMAWRADGRVYADQESPYDLVNLPEPRRFKVGDRVRIVRNSRHQAHLDKFLRREGTIIEPSEDGWSLGNGYWWPEIDLELVEPKPEPRRVWVNEYSHGYSTAWDSRVKAEERSASDRLACHEFIELTPEVEAALKEKGIVG